MDISEISDEAVLCGTTGTHAMDPFHDPLAPKPEDSNCRLYTFRCLRCGRVRWDTIERYSGRLVRRRYYPSDVSLPHQTQDERLYVADFRVEFMDRLDTYGTDEELFAAITVPRKKRRAS